MLTLKAKDGTELSISFFSYGVLNITGGVDPSGTLVASINIPVEDDTDIQREVIRLTKIFCDKQNIETITIIEETGKSRVYHFTECLNCQFVNTETRDYISVSLK